MALTSQEIREAARRFAKEQFADQTATLDAEDIRALVSDLDAYLDANQAAINSAIRTGLRARATTAQKGAALAYCAMRRTGVI